MIVFVTGGVMSSIGKGITAAALGALLCARGFRVRLRKLDPYLNIDPGTMSPYQHGEVFVTDDGAETDLDIGYYERFTNVTANRNDSFTTGRLYLNVIEKERKGEYLGKTVQIIPHITDEIKRVITSGLSEVDVMICEIGGTVGDIEGLPFLEAIRQLRHEFGMQKTLFIHLGWIPYVDIIGEIKTKPIQHSVKELQRSGIQPDILICRCDHALPKGAKEKIGLFCNVDVANVIEAKTLSSIYFTPPGYYHEGLDTQVCRHFGLSTEKKPDLSSWESIKKALDNPKESVSIGVVGKYANCPDAYRSLLDALHHGGFPSHTRVNISLIHGEDLEKSDEIGNILSKFDGILIPGGFDKRGTEGKIKAIEYARLHNIPFFGICLGFQLAIIETARNLAGLAHASSSEFGETPHPVIGLLLEWVDEEKLRIYSENFGGTMRLGAYPCTLIQGSLIHAIYGKETISERHRHRYEVNNSYVERLEEAGLFVSARHHDDLVECIERKDHPWFIGTQFHPEFKSRPFLPHPLFASFINAALMHQKSSKASS